MRSKTRYSDKLKARRTLSLSLRSHSHFTNLVLRNAHEKIFYNSVNSTLNFLLNKYWLIRGRQSIKSLLLQCVTCKCTNAKTVTPTATLSLPKFRLDYNLPYQTLA